MFKAYKYRIYPTHNQKVFINKNFDFCRLVYNLGLETKMYAYKSSGKNISFFDLTKQLTDLKKSIPWLREADADSLLHSLKDLDSAYNNFFRGKKYPKFKKKRSYCSYRTTFKSGRLNYNNNTLTIPKIPNIPIVLTRKFTGKIKTVTISKTHTGKYFASILVESPEPIPVKSEPKNTVGIDLGLSHFLITSDGIKVENPRHLRVSIDRLKILQRRASKKKKGSENRKKASLKVALLHEKIANKRTDFLQKLSTKLVRDNQVDTFCFEDLAVKNLIKNHNLAQAISDVSWSEFVRQMQYKCDWSGKNLIKIGRFEPSSKTCSGCGEINQDLQLHQREWICKCGASHDRDINAAINIKNSGLRKPGEPVEQRTLVRAEKQENEVLTRNRPLPY